MSFLAWDVLRKVAAPKDPNMQHTQAEQLLGGVACPFPDHRSRGMHEHGASRTVSLTCVPEDAGPRLV